MQLTVIEYAGRPAESETSVEFPPPGGTIGRNADNLLVLPDETRRISRLQALLQTDGTHCRLKNLSGVAVVQVNDISLECAQEHVIRPGDAIRIGPYVLRADWDPAPHAQEAHTGHSRGRAANEDAGRAIPIDPLTAFMPTTSSGERDSAFADAIPPRSDAPLRTDVAMPALDRNAPIQPPRSIAHDADDTKTEPAAARRTHDAPLAVTPAKPEAPVLLAETHAAPRPDENPEPNRPDAQSMPADALLAAFLRGAGLDKVACTWSTDQLEVAGQLLSLFANGTVELLSSRSILKREVKADMTILLDRENNPLKLLPDGSSALKQMFGLPFPGFMTPVSAVEDAFHDLHAHQIAIVAGMRAALIDLLSRCSPERIVERAGAPNRVERAVPMLRDASLWQNYARMHREMTLAVEDDFGAVFGKAFLNAYDDEVKHYQARRKDARSN